MTGRAGGHPLAELGPVLPPRLRPRPHELACGLTIGADPDAPALPARGSDSPRVAVEDVIRRALARPPCLVSFSGGRDSSAVLATAVVIARREGLALPIPASYHFANAPGSEESEWQEKVVAHLALADWERVPIVSELDSVGPVAQAMLVRHGPLWPFNAHFHVPLLQHASGGSLLTGIGGDELFGPQLWASARTVLSGRRRPRPAHALSVGLALAPHRVRQWELARRHQLRWPWLHPEVDEAINQDRAAWRSRTPLRWNAALAWWWRSRYQTVLSASMRALAADAGTQVVHPFLEESVVGAVAHHFGARGPVDRSAALRELFGDALPDTVVTRRSKAFFDEAFFSDHSRSFVASWRGDGVDTSLVDADRLALAWRAKRPDPRSFLLLQAAWLDGVPP